MIKDVLAKRKAKKAKRRDNARFIAKTRGKKLVPSRTVLRKQIWDLVSILVRRRDAKVHAGKCLICVQRPIQCGYHLIPAGSGDSVRYDLRNVVGACHPCNWAEKNWRIKYRLKHIAIFGKERIEDLETRSERKVQLKTHDLVSLRDQIKHELEAR